MSDCAKVGERRLAGAVFIGLFFMAGIVAGSGVWGMVVLSVTLIELNTIYMVGNI